MKFLSQLFTGLIVAAMLGVGAQAAEPQLDKDYAVINPPLPTDSPGKIEVLEFFSYGCPHCAQFQPQLKRWAEQLPPGVVLKRVPVAWNAPFAKLAQLYLTLEATGDLARLDDDVFTAIHKEGERLDVPRALNEWLARKGVNLPRFNEAYNSFSVQSRLRRADQQLRDYGINGVPTLAINGQFLILTENHEQMLKVADALIARLRAGKGKK